MGVPQPGDADGPEPPGVDVLAAVSDAVIAVDRRGAVTYWSPGAERFFEVRAADAVGRTVGEIAAAVWRLPDGLALRWDTLDRDEEYADRLHLTSQAGREVDVDLHVYPLPDGDGRVVGAVVVSHDVTELLAAYREREREAAFAAAVLQSLPDATVVVDDGVRFIAGNALFRERVAGLLTGSLSPGDPLLPLADALLGDAPGWADVRRGLVEVATGCQELFEAELELPTDPTQWIALQATWLPFEGGGAVVSQWDVTEQKAQEATLRRAATLDPLTRLANRDAMLARLQATLGRAAGAGRWVGVMFIDLDRFKLVNDTLGHAAGDEVLVHTARILRSQVRVDDTVARMSGDEFVVVVEVPDVATVERLAARLVDALSEPIRTRAGTALGGASVGVCVIGPAQDRPDDALELVVSADAAMYEAKAAGRGRYAWARPASPAEGAP